LIWSDRLRSPGACVTGYWKMSLLYCSSSDWALDAWQRLVMSDSGRTSHSLRREMGAQGEQHKHSRNYCIVTWSLLKSYRETYKELRACGISLLKLISINLLSDKISGTDNKCLEKFSCEVRGEYLLGKLRRKFKDNIKIDHKRKVRQSYPATGHGGPSGCERLRLPHLLNNRLTDGGKVVSLTLRQPFTPQEDSWCTFLLEVESTPGP
jgi:hypothetical protein